MPKQLSYWDGQNNNTVTAIVESIDRDVERGEDILMAGFCVVMLSSTFAPVAPPIVILPLVAIVFAISASYARINYLRMKAKLMAAMNKLAGQDKAILRPISAVFDELAVPPLVDSFNLLKNLKRTWKCVFGGIVINPLWMPIFYTMCLQINEEKSLIVLNKAVQGVLESISDRSSIDDA